MIEVRFLPRFTGNPYQKELATALILENVKVSVADDVPTTPIVEANTPLPDILHLHWVYPYLLGAAKEDCLATVANSATFLCRIVHLKSRGVAVVWTVHNILAHERHHNHVELFSRRILAWLCDALVVHCHKAKKAVKTAYLISSSKIRVIPHGHYIESYPNTVSRSDARNMLELGSEVVYLFLGQIRSYKGLSKAIDAFISLQTDQTCMLLIAGKPADQHYLNELQNRCDSHPNIRLITRYIPDDEVQVFMNAADIVICPYEDILTSGMVILAMSFGKVVVAPAIGCIPETVGDSGSVLYNPKQSRALETAMRQALILRNEEKSRTQSDAQSLAHLVNWEEVAKMTRGVYEECLRHKRLIFTSRLFKGGLNHG